MPKDTPDKNEAQNNADIEDLRPEDYNLNDNEQQLLDDLIKQLEDKFNSLEDNLN